MDAVLSAISTVGFPIAIACYALFTMQKTQTDIVNTLSTIQETQQELFNAIRQIQEI